MNILSTSDTWSPGLNEKYLVLTAQVHHEASCTQRNKLPWSQGTTLQQMARKDQDDRPSGRRPRNFHNKSRQGCGHCKLRRVKIRNSLSLRPKIPKAPTGLLSKCGEPSRNQQCSFYGVVRNHVSSAAELQMTQEVSVSKQIGADATTTLELDTEHLERLFFFQSMCTILTTVNVCPGTFLKLAYSVSAPSTSQPLEEKSHV